MSDMYTKSLEVQSSSSYTDSQSNILRDKQQKKSVEKEKKNMLKGL